MSGQAHFLFTKDASNRQGEGASYAFTVPTDLKAKVVQIELDYMAMSGTFVAGSSTADSDLIWYVYDVTNSALIEPSSIKLLSNSSTLTDKFIANFQTSATGTSYRLICHVASTSASAYTLAFKNIKISPCQYVYGTPISDWVSYTPTGSWSNTTYAGKWRRVGDSMEVNAQLTLLSAPGAATLTVNIPTGYSIDTAKLANSTQYDAGLGVAHIRDFSGNFYTASTRYNNTTSVLFTINSGGIITEAVPMTWTSADQLTARFEIPITGWSSSTQQSDGYDGRLIAARYYLASNTAFSTGTVQIPYDTKVYDTTNSYSTSTFKYTAPSSGWYRATITFNTTISLTETVAYRIDATTSYYLGTSASTGRFNGSDTFYLNAGQTFEPMSAGSGGTYAGGATGTFFTIEKLQAPATISATEVVSFDANTSTTAGSTSTPLLFTVINDNSHGAYSAATGKFTAPYPGRYFFTAAGYFSATAASVRIYKNGTYLKQGNQSSSTSVSTVSHTLNLIAGDTIEIRPDVSATANGSLELNTFSGFRIK